MVSLMLALTGNLAAPPSSSCPAGMSRVDTFESSDDGIGWAACEDLQKQGGAIALVPSNKGPVEWFSKGYEPYADPSAVEAQYYFPALGLNKTATMHDPADILGQSILSHNFSHVSWELVASAIPPIRMTGGARTFVGSRGSSVDTTFNDAGEDAAGYGFPPAVNYVFNLTNQAEGGAFISSGRRSNMSSYVNTSGMAEGLVGGELPIVVFYYPVLPPCEQGGGGAPVGTSGKPPPTGCTNNLPPGSTGSRYWTMVAAGTPDMQGSREQGVWFRYQQIECAGADMAPPCKLVGQPQYWDTFWWSRTPGGGNTEVTGPRNTSLPNASGFYGR